MGKKKKQEKLKKKEKREIRKQQEEKQVKKGQKDKKPKRDKTKEQEKQASGQEVLSSTDLAMLLRIFGDESRMKILDLLKDRSLCAAELLQSVDIVQSTLSHHMKVLTEAGIVTCTKEGKRSIYSINRKRLAQISESIMKWS
ncbi:MAG: ArsR/SmtB family transcription factor [Lachnospiraceae bacterium]|uniref:ArsR/SmtB family transcription factor n=1 Tax=Parablautia sp. Marseille-Q6255 TaxID=3039593 RepID=UPI0024BCF105|nr:metalloregulator ArsR/SmtB family transcription factor [Parablautia sp. Marseille-Q6255]